MKTILKHTLLLSTFLLFAFTTVHKYYISVSNVSYSQKDQSIQVISRVFIDDIEMLLKERYAIEANLGTEQESKMANDYLEKYFKSKFTIQVNGENKSYNFLGKKYEDDLVLFYLEAPNVEESHIKTITVQNKVLVDLYEDQQNIIHVKFKDKRKTLILTRESDKGMLKF